MKTESFHQRMLRFCDTSLLYTSRVQALPTFSQPPDRTVYTLREDESSFGISGCKRRKYASIIAWLSHQNISSVALIGGANSNHISGMLQLLYERKIEVSVYLKKSKQEKLVGNRWLLHLLCAEEDINWIPDMPWTAAENWVRNQLPTHTYLIPEGGSCSAAFPGATTLLAEIARRESQLGFQFDHIFIDSGTAMMAASLATTMHWLDHPAQLHVVMIAGNKEDFEARLAEISRWWPEWIEEKLSPVKLPQLYHSVSAKSFGSVNTTVIQETIRLAREEGILTDPIYTSKLFLSGRQIIEQQKLRGRILIIHSGGGTGLMGFGQT